MQSATPAGAPRTLNTGPGTQQRSNSAPSHCSPVGTYCWGERGVLKAGQSVSVKNPCLSPSQYNLFFFAHAGLPAQMPFFSYSLVKAPDSVPLHCPQTPATTGGTLTAHSRALGGAWAHAPQGWVQQASRCRGGPGRAVHPQIQSSWALPWELLAAVSTETADAGFK